MLLLLSLGAVAQLSAKDARQDVGYRPDGRAFVCINGQNRYTRALYGGGTEYRIETSDRPVFAIYKKRDCRNVQFAVNGVRLDKTDYCEARYEDGMRSYVLRHAAWGSRAVLRLKVVVLKTGEQALWRFQTSGFDGDARLKVVVSGIRQPKLSRNGDLGVDDRDAFEADDKEPVQQLTLAFDEDCYVKSNGTVVSVADSRTASDSFDEGEQAMQQLAGRIQFSTPDPYVNALGGALVVAADGDWDGQTWLHGCIGWRMPLAGWRAGYLGDVLGWPERAKSHFDAYAKSQVTNVPVEYQHPTQDEEQHLARAKKEWGTQMYSNGYICRNPERNDQMHHYDMNLNYIDELLWHFQYDADRAYMSKMWPVLRRHLAWEKRNFDPDGDHLYDAYCCIWASDALYYSGGAVTHSSAYNYRANRLAARIAELIGEDGTPYRKEADAILQAMNDRLWLKDKGHWAEYQDLMGLQRVHESAAVWSIYTPIDCGACTPEQAYSATKYIDREIPHIDVEHSTLNVERQMTNATGRNATGEELSSFNVQRSTFNVQSSTFNVQTIATSNWLPYSWSINNVAAAEVMHTALAYFEAGRPGEGYRLMMANVMDQMYCGQSPANFGQISKFDAARGECYRDFGDCIGISARTLLQGLFGIQPDALNGCCVIRPGFPEGWDSASVRTPYIYYKYHRQGDEAVYEVTQHFAQPQQIVIRQNIGLGKYRDVVGTREARQTIRVRVPARLPEVTLVDNIEHSTLDIEHSTLNVERQMSDATEEDATDENATEEITTEENATEEDIIEEDVTGEELSSFNVQRSTFNVQRSTFNVQRSTFNVQSSKCKVQNIDRVLNANVTDIFQNEYLTPRPPYTTLQIPVQGVGDWCHPAYQPEINDSVFRSLIVKDRFEAAGIPFRTPAEGLNIAYTSLWDNYPDSVSIPLSGKYSQAWLLMAGTTNHMQSRIANGIVVAHYQDGTADTLQLVNPDNWCPIERDYYIDGKAFRAVEPRPYRVSFSTGTVSRTLSQAMQLPFANAQGGELGPKGADGGEIPGGAATIVQMPLNERKRLKMLTLRTLSNDVVIGLMAVTLQ